MRDRIGPVLSLDKRLMSYHGGSTFSHARNDVCSRHRKVSTSWIQSIFNDSQLNGCVFSARGIPTAVLWTCSHHHIPVLYLIFNNECWGIEWRLIVNSTLGLAPKHQHYEHVDLIEPNIDFNKMAESVGVPAKTIEDPNEAHETLTWGFDQVAKGKPALIDIRLKQYTEGPASSSYIFKRPMRARFLFPTQHTRVRCGGNTLNPGVSVRSLVVTCNCRWT